MAWDKDRPYAPLVMFKEGTDLYKRGERGCMCSYSYYTPSEDDIDYIYKHGCLKEDELYGREFRPFKEVELTLTYETYVRGRSAVTFYWRDENNVQYPMFGKELDRLIHAGLIGRVIHGIWSAEKRGQNYGVRLVRLAGDD